MNGHAVGGREHDLLGIGQPAGERVDPGIHQPTGARRRPTLRRVQAPCPKTRGRPPIRPRLGPVAIRSRRPASADAPRSRQWPRATNAAGRRPLRWTKRRLPRRQGERRVLHLEFARRDRARLRAPRASTEYRLVYPFPSHGNAMRSSRPRKCCWRRKWCGTRCRRLRAPRTRCARRRRPRARL